LTKDRKGRKGYPGKGVLGEGGILGVGSRGEDETPDRQQHTKGMGMKIYSISESLLLNNSIQMKVKKRNHQITNFLVSRNIESGLQARCFEKSMGRPISALGAYVLKGALYAVGRSQTCGNKEKSKERGGGRDDNC